MANDDVELVRAYATQQSESAFSTIVSRYLGLVYSAALRHVRDPQLAEEVSQVVFIILARKAPSLGAKTILSGWLYRTACFLARRAVKRELRRKRREQEAYMQSTLKETDSVWEQLSPLLDEAMLRLGQADRDALVLRFFEGRSLREVGAALGSNEEAAKKRVNRAVEKLRIFFKTRGVLLSAGAIAGLVSENSAHAAPAGLANTISAVAITKGATTGSPTLALVKGALKIMAWTKAKTAVVTGVAVMLAATVTVTEIHKHKTYPWQVRGFSYQLIEKAPPQVRLSPAKYPSSPGGSGTGAAGIMGLNQSASMVVIVAYGYSPRIIFSTELPHGSFDYIANLRSQDNFEALRREITRQWGITCKNETRNADAMVLQVKSGSSPALKTSAQRYPYGSIMGWLHSGDQLECRTQPLREFASFLEVTAKYPVVNETGLADSFDFDLDCNYTSVVNRDWDSVNRALDPLGLEIVQTNTPIEMRVIGKKE